MISARLIKDLEKRGFSLEFPGYDSVEDEIIEILKEKNPRLKLAIPILLQDKFDYGSIIKRIDKRSKKEFDRIIGISKKIFLSEGIKVDMIKSRAKFEKNEFDYYYGAFKEYLKDKARIDEIALKKEISIRSKLDTNKALSEIFAPGKLKIMEKIFNHEKLTNSELKYYYRSIRPLIHSILNDNLQNYVGLIENTKKYR